MQKPTQKNLADIKSLADISKNIQTETDDHVWVDVIQRMESTYSELVSYQVELEEKNAALEDAQRFIQSVILSISDSLIVCDVNGHILQVNQALENAIEKTSDEIIGRSVTSIVSEEHRSTIARFPENIRSGSITDCEIDFVNNENQHIPMAVNCSPRFDHKNRLSGFVITGRPLGELRKAYSDLQFTHEQLKSAQKQLIQSEKLASLGRLVAGVAHELNNPISFLYGNMHALQGYENKFKIYIDAIHSNISQAEREKLRKELKIDNMMDDIAPLVEGSLEGAERVSDIVKNLRKFATPQKSNNKNFDLIKVIARATSWVLKASSIKPEIITDYPECLEISNSEGHVHQILINLIQNAIDAIAEHDSPKLHISIRIKNEQVEISIKDNGPGISTDNIVKIFDPFYTTKAVGRGTGLGLSISYGLATEQCHGDLKAISHENDGAEFVFSLPLVNSK